MPDRSKLSYLAKGDRSNMGSALRNAALAPSSFMVGKFMWWPSFSFWLNGHPLDLVADAVKVAISYPFVTRTDECAGMSATKVVSLQGGIQLTSNSVKEKTTVKLNWYLPQAVGFDPWNSSRARQRRWVSSRQRKDTPAHGINDETLVTEYTFGPNHSNHNGPFPVTHKFLIKLAFWRAAIFFFLSKQFHSSGSFMKYIAAMFSDLNSLYESAAIKKPFTWGILRTKAVYSPVSMDEPKIINNTIAIWWQYNTTVFSGFS